MASLGSAPATPWAGSSAGFDVLQWGWKQYHGPLVRYAYRRVHQWQEAEDAVAETFLRAHRVIRRDGFRWVDQGSGNLEKAFRDMLYTITRNICIDHFRRPQPISIEETVEKTFSTEDSQIISIVVRESLSQMPPYLAVVVQLCDLEDLSAAEAAQIVGINVPALRGRLRRGRERLRSLLRYETII